MGGDEGGLPNTICGAQMSSPGKKVTFHSQSLPLEGDKSANLGCSYNVTLIKYFFIQVRGGHQRPS